LNQKYKVLIVVMVIVIALSGYYGYEQYNFSNMQGYLQTSLEHKTAADNYLNQASAYENKSDYTNAIIIRQKGSDEISNALKNDSDALSHADGIYKDYINNDTLLLKTMSKLINFQIYLDHYLNHSLNPGQETVTPNELNPQINQLKEDISVYQSNENKIIAENPDKFKFLNSNS